MAKTLFVIGDPATNSQSFNTTSYRPLTGNCTTDTTENRTQNTMRSAGTFSGMSANMNSNTINAVTTMRFRKNAANGSQTFTIGSSTTGQFQDLVNTDTVAAGDTVDYSFVVAGTSGTQSPQIITSTFNTSTPTTLTSNRLMVIDASGVTGYTAASTTYFKALTGWFEDISVTATEASSQVKVQYAGTYRYLAVRLIANSRTTTTTIRIRKNGAAGSSSVAFGSTVSGLLEDTTNSDNVVAGDLICYGMTNGTGTLSITYCNISCEFRTTTDPGTGQILTANPVHIANSRALTIYQQIGGSLNLDNTQSEARNQTKAAEPWKFKGLEMNIVANGITAGTTVLTLRKNGVDTTLTTASGVGTTGWFQDTTHTETVAIADLLNYKVVTGTGSGTQTVTIRSLGMYTDMPGSTTIAMTPNLSTVRNKVITKI
jgi:hypothetical protein